MIIDYASTTVQMENIKPSFFICSQPNNPLGMLHPRMNLPGCQAGFDARTMGIDYR